MRRSTRAVPVRRRRRAASAAEMRRRSIWGCKNKYKAPLTTIAQSSAPQTCPGQFYGSKTFYFRGIFAFPKYGTRAKAKALSLYSEIPTQAGVAELADAPDSKSGDLHWS